ncbi:MAG: HU family DNA-binding protein [Bacillota bacterium]|mgnify:CR=1 FL=1|jgi:DNA-binding protein HU-beta|nr:HU family DNA-binding protein [Bacillota bacterium]NLL26075.1 HU family DNA-binding protein [Erysipelotrichia bacterium]
MQIKILKKDIVERFAVEFDLTKKEAAKKVDYIFETIIEELTAGNDVLIKDLGKFEIKQRAARVGINPATLEKVDVPARKTVSFKASAKLKKAVK